MVEVTHEGSMEIYKRMLENPPPGSVVPHREFRPDAYSDDRRSVVSLVKTGNRAEGITEALKLIGGIKKITEDVEGEILIKPNCNTDDPYPRDSHPETVWAIARALIDAGFPPRRIVLGEISGRFRGLPTRHTLKNLGMKKVVDDLGLQMVCFEEDEWVKMRPPGSTHWPDGIKIPRRVYEAGRVILTPIMRPHSTATFTISLKLAVGMIDSEEREWLHDGKDHYEKLVELNMAYSSDLVVADASQIITGYDPQTHVEPSIIIAGSNRVATDAVCVALMKYHGVSGVSGKQVLKQKQFVIGEALGLGSPRIEDIDLRTLDTNDDDGFNDLVSEIEGAL